MIQELVTKFALNTEDYDVAYKLGIEYKKIGQTASAFTFFQRCLERTPSKEVQYECLLLMALCYEKQGNRTGSVHIILRHAVNLIPNRPEAYFLTSRSYERNGKYVEAYTWSNVGLSVSDFKLDELKTVEYPGKWGLIFEKAVSAWHWGRGNESRKLFQQLCEEYNLEMDEPHKNSVQSNLLHLGSGPDYQSFIQYDSSKHDRLKFKFPGSNKIVNNYSQVYQDMFTLAIHKGKRNGRFLELGAYKAFRGNNTALLEKEFGWNGIAIEYVQEFANDYASNRTSKIICADALTIDYDKILKDFAPNGIIDYLQMDLEPPKVTFEALLAIPFDKYEFGVITYEHDYYIDVSKTYRKKSRSYLSSLGYVLVASNISPNEVCPFEDWWVHPDLVDMDYVKKFMVSGDMNQIEEYMLE